MTKGGHLWAIGYDDELVSNVVDGSSIQAASLTSIPSTNCAPEATA